MPRPGVPAQQAFLAKASPQGIAPSGSAPLRAAMLWAGLAGAAWAQGEVPAEEASAQASLPTVHVSGAQFDPDDVRPEGVTTATKTYTAPRDIPQTIDTVEVNKYKSYGINDLATMLDGQPGVSASYDMRGEGLTIRGFDVSSGDIYRDGVREGGQVRRSTANVERIEILKGPASVLYGRGAGGGVVNLVSKQARFDAGSSATLRGGSWNNVGGTLDINRVLSPNVAVRLTADREQAHSFRSGIRNKNEMVSPSILVDTRTGLRWTGQYTYDNVWRVPDRGPAYEQLPPGVSPRQGFAQPGDYVEDRLRVLRSDLGYDFNPRWSVRWVASRREARQDFDHYFLGTYCNTLGRTPTGAACTNPGLLRQSYAWQQTNNKTTIHTVDLTGRVELAGMAHELLLGVEHSDEERQPRLFSTAASNGFVDPFNPVFNAVRPAQGAPTQHNLHLARARALYAQDLVSLAPQWKLLVGARHDDYDFDSLNRITGAWRHSSGSSVSPRAGLVWQPAGSTASMPPTARAFRHSADAACWASAARRTTSPSIPASSRPASRATGCRVRFPRSSLPTRSTTTTSATSPMRPTSPTSGPCAGRSARAGWSSPYRAAWRPAGTCAGARASRTPPWWKTRPTGTWRARTCAMWRAARAACSCAMRLQGRGTAKSA